MSCVRHRIEVINNLETWLFAEIVDAGDIDQVVERKFISAKFRDLTKIVCTNDASRLTTKFSLVLDLLRKRTAERFECFQASHSYAVIGEALREASEALALQFQPPAHIFMRTLPRAFLPVPVSDF